MTSPRYQDLSRFHLSASERGRPTWFIFLWMFVQATAWAWSPRPLYGWRRWLARAFGAKVGRGVLIRPTARITYPWNFTIGDYSWIGDDSVMYSLGRITIGSNVAIAHNVYLSTGTHDVGSITFDQRTAPILIEDECWLPNDVFVGPGVTIGTGTVVGARSSVFSDLPGGFICLGSPARPVKAR